MAVYTHVSDQQFRELLAGYDIGAFARAEGISEGVSNTNYLLHTERGRFIFTLYEKMVNPADLPYFLGLMEHLAERGIPCPLPIHGRQGEVIQHIAGRPAAITSFLAGKSLKAPASVHCGELGRQMAKLHEASRGFPLRRANDLTPVRVWQRYEKVAQVSADAVFPGMRAELEKNYAHVAAHWPGEVALPSGIIHGDLFPDNVFFTDGRSSGIIDFYFACNDFFAYDVAIALNCWCFEHGTEFNITKAQHLLRGYDEVRKLSGEELAALPVLAAGAALRFLLTRLDGWVNRKAGALVTPKNPEEYLHRLRFHNQVKNHAEYGL